MEKGVGSRRRAKGGKDRGRRTGDGEGHTTRFAQVLLNLRATRLGLGLRKTMHLMGFHDIKTINLDFLQLFVKLRFNIVIRCGNVNVSESRVFMNKKNLNLFLLFTLFTELITIFFLTSELSDLENQFFLGLSINRWLMIIFVLFFVMVSVSLLLLINRKQNVYEKIRMFLSQKRAHFSVILFIFSILLIVLLIILSSFIFPKSGYVIRVLPIFIFLILIFGGLIFYLYFEFNEKPWVQSLKLIMSVYHKLLAIIEKIKLFLYFLIYSKWMIVILMAGIFPLIFYPALHYKFPPGYAGLFSLMTEGIIENNFKLPNSVPFYGPGGIPFSYPPFGFYVFAIVIKLFNLPIFSYLRFAPPLFLWLSVIPIFFLTSKITKSRIAAILSPIIILGSQRIFMVQGTAAGIVRGLAFLIAFWALYFFVVSMDDKTKKWKVFFAGILIGLTFLTHFSYALFILFFIFSYGLLHLHKKLILINITLLGLVSIVIILPWVLTLSTRYGWNLFLYAFRSHGNDQFLSYSMGVEKIIPWIENSLRPIFVYQFFWGILLLGLIYIFFTKQRFLSIWFLLVLFFSSESDRFLITIAGIIVGFLVSEIITLLKRNEKHVHSSWSPVLFLTIFVVIFYQYGWRTITTENIPSINNMTLELATYIKTKTPENYTFLVVANAEEAEWYPYLLNREPVIASWGAEWVGNYDQHLSWVYDVIRCKINDSFICVENIFNQIPKKPDLVITDIYSNNINKYLHNSILWNQIYENEHYMVWEFKK